MPARKVYILAPRCVASHRSKRPRRPTGHRRPPLAPRRTSPSCLSPPAVKFQISEAKHRAGSRYKNIWSLARLRPPGSQSTEPKAIPALARFGMSKMSTMLTLSTLYSTFAYCKLVNRKISRLAPCCFCLLVLNSSVKA